MAPPERGSGPPLDASSRDASRRYPGDTGAFGGTRWPSDNDRRNAWLGEVARKFITPLIAIHARIGHILGVQIHEEQYALMLLSEFRQLREMSEEGTKEIVLEMLARGKITPQQAATASGYSRTTIYNWIKQRPDAPKEQ